MFNELKILLFKEYILEMRNKYTISGILLYVFSTIYIIYSVLHNINDKNVWNALFWIVILFASVNASAKSFMQESKSVEFYLYTVASPQAIILSKIIYNIALIFLLSILTKILFSIFLGNIVKNELLFFISVILGSSAISSLFTFISALSSKAKNSSVLLSILSFPVFIPTLLILIKISKNALAGMLIIDNLKYIFALFLLNIVIILLAFILFPYLWRD